MINFIGNLASGIIKPVANTITAFTGDKKQREKFAYDLELKELEHKKANFGNLLYQVTAGSFVGLFLVLVFSPFLSRISFLEGILSDYLAIYDAIGEAVILTVLGSILGIRELGRMVDKNAISKVVNSQIALKKEKLIKDKEIEVITYKKEGELASFNGILKHLIKIEGGYANHPKDKGGETYRGIARNHWKRWAGWKIIDSEKKTNKNFKTDLQKNQQLEESVEDFYKENFWDKLRCDEVDSWKIKRELFDTAVNSGKGQAVKLLQRAINVCGYGLKIATLKEDGTIGDITIEATNMLLPKYDEALYRTMNGEQYILYKKIIEKNPSQKVFFRGWVAHRL